MKLIIDIPEEIYKLICNMENPICRTTLMTAIVKGIPIEEIRNEINAILTNSYDEGVKEKALQIIDKI